MSIVPRSKPVEPASSQSLAYPDIAPAPVRRRRSSASSLFARGEPMVWMLGGGLAICLTMIIGLLACVLYQGASTFWPGAVIRIETADGRVLMGELTRTQDYRPEVGGFDAFPE